MNDPSKSLLKMTILAFRFLALLLVLVGIPFLATAQQTADAPARLRIAIDKAYSPYSLVGPTGKATGLAVEMWQAWGEATGTPVEFIPSGWEGTLEALRSGKADVHFGLFKNASRAEWADFVEPIHQIHTSLFFRAGKEKPVPLEELTGEKVGAWTGSYQLQFLQDNYPEIEPVAGENGKDLILKLLNGEVRAVLNEVPSVEAELAAFGIRGVLVRGEKSQFSNYLQPAVRKGERELLERINEGFRKIPNARLHSLEKLWLSNPSDHFLAGADGHIEFSPEEEAWLAANPVVKLAVTTFIQPVDILDDAGDYKGLNADLIDLLNKKLGINIVPEFFDSWGGVAEAAMEGTVDGAFSLSITPEREKSVSFTKPYAFDPIIAIVSRSRNDIVDWKNLEGKTVSVVKGASIIEEIQAMIGDGNLFIVEAENEGIIAVASGTVDAHVSWLLPYGNAQRAAPVGGLKIALTRNSEGGTLRIGVHKDRPELLSILRKGLNAITREEMTATRNKWLFPEDAIDMPSSELSHQEQKSVELTAEERAWIETHAVKVGIEQWAPVVFADKAGQAQGLAGGFLKRIEKLTGLKFEFFVDDWPPLLEGFKYKTIDLLPATYYTDERATFGLYSEPYFNVREFAYVKSNNTEVRSINDLASKRIAIVEGYGTIPKIRATYPDATIVETKDLLASISAVLNGDADALFESQMVVEHTIKTNSIIGLKGISQIIFKASPIHLFSRIDEPLLQSILQKGLNAITAEEKNAEIGKWISATETERDKLGLSADELKWLSDHEFIRLGVDAAWPPFEFVDEDGEFAGISSGYVDAISKRLEITTQPTLDISWSEAFERVKDGELDILSSAVRTREREADLNFTKPYIKVPIVIATRKEGLLVSDVDDLEGKTVGVVPGYASTELLRAKHPSVKLVEMEDVATLLEALSAKEIDAVVESLWVISYEKERLQLDDIKIAALTPYNLELSMAVRKDWPELVPILDKALSDLGKQETNAIKNAWMAVHVDVGLDMKTVLIWVVPIGLGAALIIILVVYWNRQISRQKEAMEISEERTRLLLESVGEGVFGVNLEGRVTFVNPRVQKILGFDADDLMGNKIHAIIHHSHEDGSEYAVETCSMWRTYTTGIPAQVEDEVLWHKDGTAVPVEYSSTPIIRNKEVLGAVISFKDISARKKAEEEVARRTILLQAVLSSMTQGIVAFDKDLKLISWNDKFLKIREYPKQLARPGTAFSEFMKFDIERQEFADGDPELSVQKQVSRARKFEPHEFERQRPDGTFIEVRGGPIPDGGFVSTYTDITERKKAEEALAIAHNKLGIAMTHIEESINYASRIQRSVLPDGALFTSQLADHFALWEPRDVVGGDIYWCRMWGDGFLIILGDCTGHGVPGAFMTLISSGALDLAYMEIVPGDTARLLQRMHQMIQDALGQDKEDGASDDGLEAGVCYLPRDRKTLTFSGARFSLFVVDDDGPHEVKGDKAGLGYRRYARDTSFTNHQIEIRPNNHFFMTTDGLIDQIGGARKRGFGKKRFMTLIASISELPMAEQKSRIRQTLSAYQGEQQRRDDVSVLGFNVGEGGAVRKTADQSNRPFIGFDRQLSVGFDEIDADHLKLIDMVNEFHKFLAESDRENIARSLNELSNYTNWHFRHEERLMQSSHYPDLISHQNEHQALAATVVDIKKKFETGDDDVLDGVPEILRDWLINHIQMTDKKLGQFLSESVKSD